MRIAVVAAVSGLALVAGFVASAAPPSAEKSLALIAAAKANQNLKPASAPQGGWPVDTAYSITLPGLTGGQVPMSAFEGKAILLVNTASKCGLTPQYEGLQALYEAHKDEGLVVLGIPSGDFMGQELAKAEDIAEFCELNFGVTFPMAEKSSVKGKDANALHKWAVAQLGESAKPKWNFHKILIGRDGKAITAFDSATLPESKKVTDAVKAALRS
ncbi:MAG: glutathione peroxidase [Alphaproteobacteria bacterium]|nr:glutathione peroxidase [Alphaproteobacteria bacterium]